MPLIVYGIPTCGTVKKARSWLDLHGIPHQFVDFRAAPPTAATTKVWVAKFGNKALRNTSGGAYRELGPEKEAWTDQVWTQAFAADPMLIKRPVICRDGAPVLVGFTLPDAELLALLGS